MAAAGVRIHPAWWSPRLFPYVLAMGGLFGLLVYFGVFRWVLHRPGMLVFLAPIAVIAALFRWQRRLCRIELCPDSIEFPTWRWGDTSEVGIALYVGAGKPPDAEDAITTLDARAIVDWTPEAGRIVVLTRVGQKDAISLSGISERDRARIVAWLTEKVGG